MAAPSAVQNLPVQAETKSGKKKKAKAAERSDSPAPTASPAPEKATEGIQEDGSDNAYIREMQK
jgi:hypothetical protein